MSDFADLHDELRSVARDVLADAADPSLWQRATELGWLGLEVPGAHGGADATFAETAVVLEELGRAVAPGPFVGTSVLGVAAARAVDADSATGLLARVATGEERVAVALAPSGDQACAEPAFSLRDGRLSGVARHVLDAPEADRLLLLAYDGAEPVIVSMSPSAVVVTSQPVLDATRSLGTVEAADVAVVEDDVWTLGANPEGAVALLFERGATALAIDALGVAAAMLDATVAYVGERHQFGRAIGSFQAVKHQCADVLVELHVGGELARSAVEALVVGEASGEADAWVEASRAKAYCGALAVRAAGTAMQLHGGIGYTWESGVHRYLKRATLDRALFGSPERHHERLGARFAAATTAMK